MHTDAKSYQKSFVNVVRVNDFIIPTTNRATCTRMCAQYSCFLIFGFNSNQEVHLDSLSLHSTGRQVDWHFRRSEFVLRPFIGRPNCASDSAAGTLRESWCVRAHTWAGSWYIYSRQQRQVKSRQVHTRSSVYLSLYHHRIPLYRQFAHGIPCLFFSFIDINCS